MESSGMSGTRDPGPSEPPEAPGVALVDPAEDEAAESAVSALAELEARLRAVSAAYKDKCDEIESTKQRLARQAAVQEEMRRGEVVGALFEPVENLHRAIATVRGAAPDAADGLHMVHAQFMTALRNLGLEEVPGEGHRFDPTIHEAIATQPVLEPDSDGKVIQVYAAGYRIGNRLVRAARVIIGAYQEPVTEA
jgi:molecular chaperone GrpE